MAENKTTNNLPAETTEQIVKEVQKKGRARGHGGNGAPTFGKNGELYVDENDKRTFIRNTMGRLLGWYDVPPVKNDEEAKERIADYFEICIEHGRRPLIEELALALGVTTMALHYWETGQRKTVSKEIIQKAKQFIAAFDAEAAAAGKINPVLYFFRAKNYYGMRDQQDIVISPNTPLGSEPDADKLEEKYAESVVETTAETLDEN